MELISVRELFKNTAAYADREITVGGWVRNRRPSKQFGFIVLNDGTYFTPVQIVYNDTLENFQEISKINIGAALIIKGRLVLTPDSKQPFEIQADTIEVEGPSTVMVCAWISKGCLEPGVRTTVPLMIRAAPMLILEISWKFSRVSL